MDGQGYYAGYVIAVKKIKPYKQKLYLNATIVEQPSTNRKMNDNLIIKIWAFFMKIGDKLGCHQKPERSFFLYKYQFPLCSRCTGILSGQIICFIAYVIGIRISFIFDILFLSIMFLDWYLQYKNIIESTNLRRFITGNLAGIAQISIILKLIFIIFKI